jgi:Acyltransferase family
MIWAAWKSRQVQRPAETGRSALTLAVLRRNRRGMATTSGPAGVAAPRRRHFDLESWARNRQRYLDNLKVILIAMIIAIHGVLGYVGFDQLWSYADVQEVTLAPVTELILFTVIGPFALFMIALLFLVAGMLTRPSLERKGPGRFAADRLLRLGVPFAVFTFGLWPLLMYALYHPLGAAPGSYWEEFVDESGNLDTGPLWFVGVLLIFSLGYAAWVGLARRTFAVAGSARQAAASPLAHDVTTLRLLLVAGIVAATTFLVRLVFPFGSESFTDLNVWEWPACIALFALGIAASRQRWLTLVPDRLRRQCRLITLTAAAAMAALGFLAAQLGVLEQLIGGWNWPALAFAAIESLLTVLGSVWLLGAAQRHLGRRLPLGPKLARSSYAAFMVQGIILIGLALALRPIPIVAEVKALVVAGGGVAGSFVLAWLLISRVPGIARVL